ncbi:glycosyltransferase family 2 protein [Cellulophaga sp. BC115SP]|uniref:glycosyltransferase family 2 protein n=1 Tax=Cellulophaga sp. BC115SP TaxID=2683263 RepID=UPI001412942E|nr:glycosyltransferase family 2 protein [Cellulophaga sp. BC115SP]NBB27622.1 rhamnosyltransferase [Cellulophaga sp. BC115SP]
MTGQIAAVIVTYHPLIANIQQLLERLSPQVDSIVMVDNGSHNVEEIEKILINYPQTTLISLADNHGIGFAQNKGIVFALEKPEIGGVILFDHDSLPEAKMVQQLLEAWKLLAINGHYLGAVGPIYRDPRTLRNYPISVFQGFRLIHNYPQNKDTQPISASFLISSGCLIDRKTLETTGFMNEDFFIDYIDIEWSFRACNKGFELFAIPTAIMWHQVGDDRLKVLGREISVHSPLRRYYLARNSILMLKQSHIHWQYKVRELFYTVSRVVVYIALVPQKRKYLKYILYGWYDGIVNRVGKSRLSS